MMFGLLFCLSVYGFTDFEALFNAAAAGIYKVSYSNGAYTLGSPVKAADLEKVFNSYTTAYCTEDAQKQCVPSSLAGMQSAAQTEAPNKACNLGTAATEYAASYLFDFYARTSGNLAADPPEVISIPFIACYAPSSKGKDPMDDTKEDTGVNCAAAKVGEAQKFSHILPVLTSIIAHPPFYDSCVPRPDAPLTECPTKCSTGATSQTAVPLFDNFKYHPVVVGVTQGTIADLKTVLQKFGPVVAKVSLDFGYLDTSTSADTKFAENSGVICNGAKDKKTDNWIEVLGYQQVSVAAGVAAANQNAEVKVCVATGRASNAIAAQMAWILRSPYSKTQYATPGANSIFYMYEAQQVLFPVAPVASSSNADEDTLEPPFADKAIEYYFIAYDNYKLPTEDGAEVVLTLSADKFVGTAAVPTTLKTYDELKDDKLKDDYHVFPAATLKAIKETANVFKDSDPDTKYDAQKANMDCLLYSAYRAAPIENVASFTGSLSMLPDSSNGQGIAIKRAEAATITTDNLMGLATYVLPKSGLVDVACVTEVKAFAPVTGGKCTATGKTTEEIKTFASGFTTLYTKKPPTANLKKNIAKYGPAAVSFDCLKADWDKYANGDVADTTIFTPTTGADKKVHCTILGWQSITPAASNAATDCWIVKFIENVGKTAAANTQTTIGNVAVVTGITDVFDAAVHYVTEGSGPAPGAAFSMSIPSKIVLALISLYVVLF